MGGGVVTLRVSATSLVRSQPREGEKRNTREIPDGPTGWNHVAPVCAQRIAKPS